MRATSLIRDGYATGLLVEKLNHRTLKIEGNPEHPAGLPASAAGLQRLLQATVAQLYHPGRSRRVRRHRCPTSWAAVLGLLRAERADRGAGLRLLLGPTSSPLLLHLIDRVHARFPAARVTFHAPRATDNALEGARLAFGAPLLPHHDFAAAQVVLALESDLLEDAAFAAPSLAAWCQRRTDATAAGAGDQRPHLHVVDDGVSATGAQADQRLVRPRAQMGGIMAALAAAHGLFDNTDLGLARPARPDAGGDEARRWLRSASDDLARRPPGSTLVVVGQHLPPAVHAAGHALNHALGNFGRTVGLAPPVLAAGAAPTQTLPQLVREIHDGKIDALVIIDANCVVTAPAELALREALARVPDTFYFGTQENETARACHCFGPTTHFLETWGDARAYDGTVSFLQPLVHPLVDARPASEILAVLAGDHDPQAQLLLRDYWLENGSLSEADWRHALERGFLADSRFAVVPTPALDLGRIGRALAEPPARRGPRLAIRPAPLRHDAMGDF